MFDATDDIAAQPGRKRRRSALIVKRLPVCFASDRRRVITRFFDPGGQSRIRDVFARVLRLPHKAVVPLLEGVYKRFRTRHEDFEAILEHNYAAAALLIGVNHVDDLNRRLLLGSYFTMEYSIESAALFNPSIVPHPSQENLPEGAFRFIMSFRATGEGHVSSVVFRTGVIYSDHVVQMDPPSRIVHPINLVPDEEYDKALFRQMLKDIRVPDRIAESLFQSLGNEFTMAQMEAAISAARASAPEDVEFEDAVQNLRWLASSNYKLQLPPAADASELVIFPQTCNESRGIEDARLVRFVDDDGAVVYYGTCTAYDGYRILPELIETSDFQTIGVHTLNGAKVQNKGLALFPRRIRGKYVMCARVDGENLYIMYSDAVYFWKSAQLLKTPTLPWEFVQIGNCGSPLETPQGWLMLTHGVGPMRTYCIGAMLLDLDDPTRVIGMLEEPLIMSTEKERDGYVPNVVYSCGALLHQGCLYVPFSTSDTVTQIGMIAVDRVLSRLLN